MKTKHIIPIFLVALCVALYVGYAVGVLTTTKEIQTGANVITDVSLSVYENFSATEELTYINWGDMLPTESKQFSIYVENTAAIPLEISVTTKDWNPAYAEAEFTFVSSPGGGWGDYPILRPGFKEEMMLTLTAGENPPSGASSFTIVITGTSI